MASARQQDDVPGGSPGEVGLLGWLLIKTLLLITPALVGATGHPAARDCPGSGAVKAGTGSSPGTDLGKVWMGWWFLSAGLAAACSAYSPI